MPAAGDEGGRRVAELTGRRRFAHLFRRAGFGATPAEIDAAMATSADEESAFRAAVDALLNYQAVSEVPDRVSVDPNSGDSLILWWLERMVRTRRPLLEKLVLFWHDHFATAEDKAGISITFMLRQNDLFRAMALGRFEAMLDAVSRDPAMVFWLDLNANRKTSPNENYAREVMELFSLGVGRPGDPNYSEDDVKQATRAFTGYTIDQNGNWYLNAASHDGGTKTVLGQHCESGDEVHMILLRHVKNGRNVSAHFLTAKLFSWYAYPVAEDDPVVLALAPGFASSGHNVLWLVEAILKSPEFSSLRAYRALIKSPVELAVQALRLLGAERVPASGVLTRLRDQGMRLFYPPDVSGWPSGRVWINASTVLSRCNMAATIVNSLGKTAATDAGGAPVVSLLAGLPTAAARVDAVLARLVDGDVSPATRDALVAYASTAATDEKLRGLFNLVMALPAFQLN
ncbi:MAG: DUF1800 domain-containing protein [Chloroflexi bacterium]|nr:DUF1800 domain-containing protein [Chloroflexota bacterium]